MNISFFFLFVRGVERLERLIVTRLYRWQGFVSKKPKWSPIRELATPAGTYTGRATFLSFVHYNNLLSFKMFR